MFKHGANGPRVGENISENSVRITAFQQLMESFPDGEAQKTIVRKGDVVNRGFIFSQVRRWDEGFIQESSDVIVNDMQWETIILKKVGEELNFIVD